MLQKVYYLLENMSDWKIFEIHLPYIYIYIYN